MAKRKKSVDRLVPYVGILAALALILGLVESILPPIPGMPPGVKLGLSNIVVLFCADALGLVPALCIALIKGLFALLLRGALSGLLSLCGGIFSVLVICLVLRFPKRFGLLGASMAGAVTHNFMQLLAVTLLTASPALSAYLPLLLVSGVVMGFITALILCCLLPLLQKAKPQRYKQTG